MPKYKDFWIALGTLIEIILPPMLVFIIAVKIAILALRKFSK